MSCCYIPLIQSAFTNPVMKYFCIWVHKCYNITGDMEKTSDSEIVLETKYSTNSLTDSDISVGEFALRFLSFGL